MHDTKFEKIVTLGYNVEEDYYNFTGITIKNCNFSQSNDKPYHRSRISLSDLVFATIENNSFDEKGIIIIGIGSVNYVQLNNNNFGEFALEFFPS